MRRLALAFALIVGFFSAPALAAETIDSFSSEVVVRPDGVLDVTETITVSAEGDKISHGIYRDFPLTFTDADGHSHRVSFTIGAITRDGKPEPWHKASNQGGIRIYIGDGNVVLDPGTYTYRIRYETGRQIRFFPDHTELFWNVTGNDWVFPILKTTALFTLPDHQPPTRWTAYTGRYGERGKAYDGTVTSDNRLQVATTRTLAAGEGLSVVLEIPKGLVLPPSGSAGVHLLVSRQPASGVRRRRPRRRADLLPACLARGRPRPAEGDDHPAVPRPAGHFADACRLYPRLRLEGRLAQVHRGRPVARGQGAHRLQQFRRATSFSPEPSWRGRRRSCPRARTRCSNGWKTRAARSPSTRTTARACRPSLPPSSRASKTRAATASSGATSAISSLAWR